MTHLSDKATDQEVLQASREFNYNPDQMTYEFFGQTIPAYELSLIEGMLTRLPYARWARLEPKDRIDYLRKHLDV